MADGRREEKKEKLQHGKEKDSASFARSLFSTAWKKRRRGEEEEKKLDKICINLWSHFGISIPNSASLSSPIPQTGERGGEKKG